MGGAFYPVFSSGWTDVKEKTVEASTVTVCVHTRLSGKLQNGATIDIVL